MFVFKLVEQFSRFNPFESLYTVSVHRRFADKICVVWPIATIFGMSIAYTIGNKSQLKKVKKYISVT